MIKNKFVNFLNNNEFLFCTIIFLLSIFFWDLKINNHLQSKFLIVLLLPYLILNYKNYNILKILFFSLGLIFLLILHSLVNVGFEITNYFIFSIIFFYLLIFTSLYLTKNFEKIFETSLIVFIVICNALILYSILIGNFTLYDHNIHHNGLCLIFFNESKSIFNILFYENSHFGMTATGVIIYQILNFKNLNFFNKFNFLIFFLLSFMFIGSLTFYLGITLSALLLIILRISKKVFPLILLVIINVLLIYNLNNCAIRISQIADLNKVFVSNENEKFVEIVEYFEEFKELNLDNKIIKFFFRDKDESTLEINEKIRKRRAFDENNNVADGVNVTTIVHINHLLFAVETFKENLFGVGFQNYGIYSKKFAVKHKIIDQYSTMPLMNFNDGASNLNKLLAEFAIFNILFGFLFLYCIFKSNLSPQLKCFIFTLVITQLLRGAGYFNGGFIFFIMILFFSTFVRKLNDTSSSI